MHQTRLKQSVNHLCPSLEAFGFPNALFRNITGEATEAPTNGISGKSNCTIEEPKKFKEFAIFARD